MAIRELEKQEWQQYFSHLPQAGQYEEFQIEVISPRIGAQVDAAWEPFKNMKYDPSNDEIEILSPKVGHFIRSPQQVTVEANNSGAEIMEVIDKEQTKFIISLRTAKKLER
ncbi:hypothetical protein EBR25_00255 [bacterium]|nr:hypothetical protein [bacterium]